MLIEFEGADFDLHPTKIVAVARNYGRHAAEMGGTAPAEPKFFIKPPTALISHHGTVILPPASRRVDYEAELAVIIKERIKNATPDQAMQKILGYSVLVDVTARDIQDEAKKCGMPWTIAKCFDTFAPVGPRIVPPGQLAIDRLRIWLRLNDELKQDSSTAEMIHPVDRLLAYISTVMTLEPHDIVATGTPEGVGPMQHGDRIRAGIDGIGVLEFDVARL